MRTALDRAARLARIWNRRRGGSDPLAVGDAGAHSALPREDSIEAWARLGGGLMAPEPAEQHRSAALAPGSTRARSSAPVMPPSA